MVAINDLDTYTSGMKRSIDDKLFFLPYLDDIGSFVDFGCADGTMLSYIHEINPDLSLHGIDNSKQMLDRCQHLVPDAKTYMRTVPAGKGINYSDSALNLSSVLHELYSYSSYEQIADFWRCIDMHNYKYIFIRDMCNDSCSNTSFEDEIAIRRNSQYSQQLAEFENIWGSIGLKRQFVHFLLKYRYKTNWDREVQEDYLPVSKHFLLSMFHKGYELVYLEHYTLPFLKKMVEKDFGIQLSEPTHIKMIFRAKL